MKLGSHGGGGGSDYQSIYGATEGIILKGATSIHGTFWGIILIGVQLIMTYLLVNRCHA